MLNSLLKIALGLEGAVVEGARIEGDSIIVSARPRRRAPRCPVCGRRCGACDALPARRWRAPDLGGTRCHVEHAPRRVECPEHGVLSEVPPWARTSSSRFTSAFEDEVAWLALHMCRSALAELMRVDWHTVGGICKRVSDDLEARDGRSRLDGLRSIGIDETSYKKGHRYMTVVVDHDRGQVVWAAKGHGRAVLDSFLDLLMMSMKKPLLDHRGYGLLLPVLPERLGLGLQRSARRRVAPVVDVGPEQAPVASGCPARSSSTGRGTPPRNRASSTAAFRSRIGLSMESTPGPMASRGVISCMRAPLGRACLATAILEGRADVYRGTLYPRWSTASGTSTTSSPS